MDPVLDARRLARLRWRCRRGMRELDVVLVRYLEQDYSRGPRSQQQAFESLLELQDPTLLGYLLGRLDPPDDPCQSHVLARLTRHRDPGPAPASAADPAVSPGPLT